LLAIKESPVTTGRNIFELFLTFMNYIPLYWKTGLKDQSYVDGSKMSGHYNGLQAHIRRESLKVLFIWCHAHWLTLVVKQAVSVDTNTIDLFGNLEAVYTFLWCSIKELQYFENTNKNLTNLQKCMLLKVLV
jgi:hypothetical protein